jgi:hypothetical protein
MTSTGRGRHGVAIRAAKETSTRNRGIRHTSGSTKDRATQSVARPHLNGSAAPGAVRLQLRDAGYDPIPIKGKIPPLNGWQTKFDVDDDEVKQWAKDFPHAKSTGLLTKRTPTIDIDIKIEKAALAVEEMVRERFKAQGKVMVRVGNAPKRAIPFRADTPFKKITANLTAPDGSEGQKIELLADGQQYVAFGIHEDTHKPYTWSGGEPGKVTRDELPTISEKQARKLVEDAATLLIRDHGYKPAKPKPKEKANGAGGGPAQWQYLTDNIRAGTEWHDSIRDLAAMMTRSGMSSGAAVNFLYALMDSSDAPHDHRWIARRGDIKRAVETATGLSSSNDDNDEKSSLIYFNDAIAEEISKEWLIKGVMAKGETSSWVGPPKSGKSALLTDICIALSSTRQWRGYTVKKKVGCVYFALERGDLIKRRMRGYAQRDKLKDLPIAIRKGIVDLMDPKCVDHFVTTIKEAATGFGCDVGLIIIDTFSKGIAAGGGDENTAKDQNRVYANLRTVQELTGVHVALVHHTGKDESKGARGSSAHAGDMDVLIQFAVEKNFITVRVTDANDQATGVMTRFEMEDIRIGVDEDGDSLHTFIVDLEDEYGKEESAKKLSPQLSRAMELLNEVISTSAKRMTIAGDLHDVVTLDQWKEACVRGGLSAGDEKSFGRIFRRAFDVLVEMHRIGTLDGMVWPIYGVKKTDSPGKKAPNVYQLFGRETKADKGGKI